VLNKAQDDDLVMSLVEQALARPADERAACPIILSGPLKK
jgi:hypothetical protein